MKIIGNGWDKILEKEYEKPYFSELVKRVREEYSLHTCYPPKPLIFSALKTVDYDETRVVILGQDPYHGVGQANGMAFAVQEGVKFPPSLENIFTEIESDLGVKLNAKGTLIGWAKQGVLLLNTVLSVRAGQAFSHSEIGWKEFTDSVISALSAREKPMAFILWGNGAISKKSLIAPRHFIVASPHPSPLSAYRGFFGSRPFSKVNEFLRSIGEKPIDWTEIDENFLYDYYKTSEKIKII